MASDACPIHRPFRLAYNVFAYEVPVSTVPVSPVFV